MRVIESAFIRTQFPLLEETLWNIACHAKSEDPEIKLCGLYVRVLPSRLDKFSGWAMPREESRFYSRTWIHPAGRINLNLGETTTEHDIIRLFAHELRHIGNFHRGRQLYGFLTDKHMKASRIEADSYEFEEVILSHITGKCAHGSHCNNPDC